jgi:L-amino acid N-acyltransferase YncA
MALALTDIGLGQRAADAGLVTSGARMVALATRVGVKGGFWPTVSPVRARRAAQDADAPAYDDAVSSYAGLDAAGLRTAARAALAARTRVSG